MGNHDPYSDTSGVRASLAPKATFTTASWGPGHLRGCRQCQALLNFVGYMAGGELTHVNGEESHAENRQHDEEGVDR